MKRILALVGVIAALFVINAPSALAATLEVSIDTVVRADEGSVTQLASTDTSADLIGSSCVVVAMATNQPSVHRQNDLIVASGDGSIVLKDVEREPGVTTRAEEMLTLGPTVAVSLRMGPDEVFSAGITVTLGECTPPTTTTTTIIETTTTTIETTTTTMPKAPAIEITKTADPVEYGADGIGYFTIEVTNPGPVDLTNVRVTDDIALEMDANSNCPRPELPDLAVGESYGYDCTVANLDGVSPFTNEATAFGIGPDGTEVTDTDDAVVVPPVLATTITQPPTTAPPPTLPETGVPFEQVRGFGAAGISALLVGVALLFASAWLGRSRIEDLVSVAPFGPTEFWLELRPKSQSQTFYVPLRRSDARKRSE